MLGGSVAGFSRLFFTLIHMVTFYLKLQLLFAYILRSLCLTGRVTGYRLKREAVKKKSNF